MRIWLLAAQLDNKIPHDDAWVAKQISARTVDLSHFISRGFLEIVYSTSSLEKRREEKEKIKEQYVAPNRPVDNLNEHVLTQLLDSLKDKDAHTERTIRKLIRVHGLVEADLAWARECASGPGVNSPSGVAVAELKKRGLAKGAA